MDWGEKNIEKEDMNIQGFGLLHEETGYVVAILFSVTELKELDHWTAMYSIYFIRGK
jgi:hypothetical protein